jgi:Na+/H+ antiporter NhaD/arsenite permease-like protein
MRLDLRYPLGTLFTVFGLLLVVYGLSRPGVTAPLTAVNVNLYSGLPMLVFGVVMLWLARRAESRPEPGAGS